MSKGIPESFEMVEPLPDDMVCNAVRLLKTARENGLLMAQEAKIAHVYDRKGYLTMDTFAGPRNTSYGTEEDDIVIQVTVRIQNPQMFSGLTILKNEIIERRMSAERVALEAQRQKLEDEMEEVKKKLSNLGVQQ